MIFPVFISCLTIYGYLTIATFEPARTTTILDTKQPSLTEKSTENEGLSPVTTRCINNRAVTCTDNHGGNRFLRHNLSTRFQIFSIVYTRVLEKKRGKQKISDFLGDFLKKYGIIEMGSAKMFGNLLPWYL